MDNCGVGLSGGRSRILIALRLLPKPTRDERCCLSGEGPSYAVNQHIPRARPT
jgi:hypothetical protein